MSNYEHGNWYCKPADEAEAKEIIERAVASGARNDYGRNGSSCRIPYGVAYGCVDCGVTEGTEYTIEQVREKFPLPGEQTKWNGEGLPPIGTICASKCPSGMTVVGEILKHHSDGVCALFLSDDEFTVFWQKEFQPLRNERESWVEQALGVLQKDPCALPSQFVGMIYDAIQSGELKMPEVK